VAVVLTAAILSTIIPRRREREREQEQKNWSSNDDEEKEKNTEREGKTIFKMSKLVAATVW
jgi:hypothetical protein